MATPRFFENHKAMVERPAMEYECNTMRTPINPTHNAIKLNNGMFPNSLKPLMPIKTTLKRSVKRAKNFENETRSNNRPILGRMNIVARCANEYALLNWVRERDKSRQMSFKNGLNAAVRPRPLRPSANVTMSKTRQPIFQERLKGIPVHITRKNGNRRSWRFLFTSVPHARNAVSR